MFALITDVMLASAPIVMISFSSFNLHVCYQLGCVLLMLMLFNFMHSSCLIGLPCVCARACEIGGIVSGSHCLHPRKPSQSVGSWMWLKSLKSSCKMDGWNPERIRGRWEEPTRIGSEGCGITLLKSGLKQLVPPPGLFFTPFTTKDRLFITLWLSSDIFFICFCCFVCALLKSLFCSS